jgi:RHS repeat-associated protein
VANGAELMTETGSLRFVVGLNALAAGYDANGNMTLRLKDGARNFLAYDAESRLTSVSGTVSANFTYNGDGQRVTATIGTAAITTYIGGYFEWQDGVGTSYYFAGAQRIAMRTSTDLKFLLGDHLGSTSVTALASGAFDTETRYYPWGGVRWASGVSPTDYLFTGQQEIATIGLYFYNSRFYDAALGRFVSPDSIIPNPGNSISFDRFAYVRNNPLRFTDPNGHDPHCVLAMDDQCVRMSDKRTIEPHFTQEEIDIAFNKSYAGLGWTNEQILLHRMSHPIHGSWEVSSSFGAKRGDKYHPGVDFTGDPDIYSVYSGKVVAVTDSDEDMGLKVVVEMDINGELFYAVYGHLKEANVGIGQEVGSDTILGVMGETGTTGGVHLHFEIRKSANVNVDSQGDYSSLKAAYENWWALSAQSLQDNWVDLGEIYGDAPSAP